MSLVGIREANIDGEVAQNGFKSIHFFSRTNVNRPRSGGTWV